MHDRPIKGLELSLVGVAALVLVAAALIGPGGGDGKSKAGRTPRAVGTTAFDEAKIDVAKIKRRVERLRSLRFRRPLGVTFASPHQAARLMAADERRRNAAGRMKVQDEEVKLLGLVPPSTNLAKLMKAVDSEEVLGFYDEHSQRLVVIRQGGTSRALLEITLAHELDHALDDQNFGLETPSQASDDAALSADALFEGTATSVMTDYASRYFRLKDLLGVLSSLSGTEAKLPKFVEDSLLFSYDAGETFVTALRERGWRRAGLRVRGWRAINYAFRHRPRSTEQIMHPEKFVAGQRGAKVRIPPLGLPRRNWRRVDDTSVGEFDLEELFSVVGDERSRRPAKGWNGGVFELWRATAGAKDPCPVPCIKSDLAILRVGWDSRHDRRDGEAAFRRAFERGLAGKLVRLAGGIGVWSSRGGSILMAGGSNQTDVVLAPSAGLGARVLLRLVH